MGDNLVTIGQCNPKGRFERKRKLRLMSGLLDAVGSLVTLAKDEIPFKPRQYRVVGKHHDGTPLVSNVS